MILINQMKDMKIYKRPMFLPTEEGSKKLGSSIFLLTPNYNSSRKLMNHPLLINKLRFQSYYLEQDVSYYISGKVAKNVVEESYFRDATEYDLYQAVGEMSAAERKSLKLSQFGIPDKRKFPLDSAAHVRSAIKFFNYASEEDQPHLAKAIIKAAKKYGVEVNPGERNNLSKYVHHEGVHYMNEAATPELNPVFEARGLQFHLDYTGLDKANITGFYNGDIYNAIVDHPSYSYRLRGKSEMLVINTEDNTIYLERDKGGGCYRTPGGSWNENEDHMYAAIRETNEEARLNVKNVKYALSYVVEFDETPRWLKKENIPKELWWKGQYIELYIGEYDGPYKGHVDPKDRDTLAANGEWYKITPEIIEKLNPYQQEALSTYFTEKEHPVDEAVTDDIYEHPVQEYRSVSATIIDKFGNIVVEDHIKCRGYTLPGGKIDPGETPEEALRREIKEELGIEITDMSFNTIYEFTILYPDHNKGDFVPTKFTDYNYTVYAYKGTITNMEPTKHRSVEFRLKETLMLPYVPTSGLLKCYLKDEGAQSVNAVRESSIFSVENGDIDFTEYVRYEGYDSLVNLVKGIINPDTYYEILKDDLKFGCTKDDTVPVLELICEGDEDFQIFYPGTGSDGKVHAVLHISDYAKADLSMEEYSKHLINMVIEAVISTKYASLNDTIVPYIIADYLTGRITKYAAYGKEIIENDGIAVPNLLSMAVVNPSTLIGLLRDYDIKFDPTIEYYIKKKTPRPVIYRDEYHSIKLQSPKVGQAEMPGDSEIDYYTLDGTLDEVAHLQFGNVLTFFQEDAKYNTRLRQLFYDERIRKRSDLMEKYKKVKADNAWIKYTYPDLTKYKRKNLFIDLYYYTELFFKNNDWNNVKSYGMYLELLDRLLNDPRIKKAGYSYQTIFIPVMDWTHDKTTKMWMYKVDLNPVSIIYNLMLRDTGKLKKVFGKRDIVFFVHDKFFKINFSRMEEPNKQAVKFRTFIQKMIMGEEFDPVDVDDTLKDTPESIKAQLNDKIEDAKGVDLTGKAETVAKKTEELEKKNQRGNVSKVSDPTVDPEGEEPVYKADAKKDMEDVKLSKDVDPEEIEAREIDAEKLARVIDDISKSSDSIDDALMKIDDDPELKQAIIDIQSMKDETVKIDPARAARMNNLDTAFLQKKIGNRSVSEILDPKHDNEPLEKVSIPVASPNEEWKELTYVNFDKKYDMEKDIVACFYHFTKTSKPIAIRNLTAVDASTSEDRIITYTCEMEDFKGTRFTLKLDIPIVKDNRMLLRGNTKALQTQLVNMPIIKTEQDTAQIVTNYQKIFIRIDNMIAGRSLPATGKFLKAIRKYNDLKKGDIEILWGDSTKICDKYQLPIDYIDIASAVRKITFKSLNLTYYFDPEEIRGLYEVDDKFGVPYAVKDGKVQYYTMNDGQCIAELIIVQTETKYKELSQFYQEMKPAPVGTYSVCSILNTKIPLAVVCAYAEGLSTVLKKAGVKYWLKEKLDSGDKEAISMGAMNRIRFSDGYLVYESTYTSEMLLNGIAVSDPENYSYTDIDNKNTYLQMLDLYGGRLKSDGLDNFYDCLIDPITYECLEYYNLPTDYVDVLLYANLLLTDNKFISHTDMSSRRIRRAELVAAYTYEALSESYAIYSNMIKHSHGKATMGIKQSIVIDKIMQSPICSDDSIISALNALETTNTFTFKGKAGLNSARAYGLDKRGFDPSMLNLIGMSTNFSGSVGVSRQATMDMNIESSRGYVKLIDGDTNKFSASKTFCATEALTPFGATRDDASRTFMTFVQTAKHAVRVEQSDPNLITNGADGAIAYMTTDKFAYKAKQGGKVKEITDDYIIVEYDDKSKDYINLAETVEKNSDGGYYVPLKLDKAPGLKVGDKFKENQILAYDFSSFSQGNVGESDDINYNIGTLVKIAILNTDECFEDSGIATESLAKRMATKVVEKQEHVIDKDANVFKIVKVGDEVEVEDALIMWQDPHDEEEADTLVRILADDEEAISELGRKTIRSESAGKVVDIKIFRTVEIEELSPSLQKIVKAYEKPIKDLEKKLKSEGLPTSGLPATYKLEPNGKLKKAVDAIYIEFYVEHTDTIAVGDKITHYSANKAVIRNIIPDELAPYTDFRPKEPIDCFSGMVSIDHRKVTSIIINGSINKALIELDRSVKDILGIKWDETHV